VVETYVRLQPGRYDPACSRSSERGISAFRARMRRVARSPDDGVRGGGRVQDAGEYRFRWRRSVCWWGCTADRVCERRKPDDGSACGPRAREMALRVSIGADAGAWATRSGRKHDSRFSGDSCRRALRMVVRAICDCPINPPDNPARLFLSMDWRVIGFGLVLTLGVTSCVDLRRRCELQPSTRLTR